MRPLILALTMAVALGSTAIAAPICKTGVACGNSCIAKDKVCHVKAAPNCKTGVPCGNSCIAKGKVCHKPA